MTRDEELELVLSTARLARLELTEEEAQRLGGQFARILEAFQVIAQLDLEGVEPMTSATDLCDVMREDVPRPSLPVDQALANAPQRIEDYYGVPKTIGGER